MTIEHYRAHSMLTVTEQDEEKRVIRGIASTPKPGRDGHIVEPLGVRSQSELPLLLYHDGTQPVGRARLGRATAEGVPFEATLPHVRELGRLRERVDEAWQMLKYGLIKGVSIGFNGVNGKVERLKDGNGLHFLEIDVFELSLVPVPADASATIQTVRSIDEQQLAALGHERLPPADRARPGASGHKQRPAFGGLSFSRSQKGITMKPIKELRELRSTKAARLHELVEAFKADDHEDDEAENQEFDALTAEVRGLDTDIRVAQYHAMNSAQATPVEGKSSEGASRSRGGMVFVPKQDPDEKFKGQFETRRIIARAVARLMGTSAAEVAEQRGWNKTHPNLFRVIRAGVAGAGTGSGEWGSELTQADTRYRGDFIEFLYGLTAFDQLPLQEVPARVHIKGQDGGGTAKWVGENKGIAVTTFDFLDVELVPHKVAAISVVSNEWLMSADPAGEMLVRNGLGKASAKRIDQTFLSADAEVSGVSPAGILNGVTAIVPSGADAAAIRTDIQSLMMPYITALNGRGVWLVMNPGLGMAMASLTNALGQPDFPDLTEEGGTLARRRVVVGDNVPGGYMIAIKPEDVWKIGDSGVQVAMSDTAMIEQDSAPAGATDTPVAATANLTSMFQEDSTAFRVIRHISFAKRRSHAVQWIDNAEYGGVVS